MALPAMTAFQKSACLWPEFVLCDSNAGIAIVAGIAVIAGIAS